MAGLDAGGDAGSDGGGDRGSDGTVQGLVDHLFRREFGRLVATLTRIFGPSRLELAEDVAQEALLRALRLWSVRGVPEQPGAWLQRVAQNLALDAVRREARVRDTEEGLRRWIEQDQAGEAEARDPLDDDSLRLLLLCCHDALAREAQLALTLKTVGGFGVEEIARAFLVRPATIAQRLVRAKRRLRGPDVSFELPDDETLRHRVEAVLDVLYLMFNEGYECTRGDAPIRRDLVDEALRLTGLLLRDARTRTPAGHALMALMLLHSSRLDARLDAAGQLLLLEDQDRARWDRGRISEGLRHLRASMSAERPGRLHLEAGIASCHAVAPSLEDTDWAQILAFYDQLLSLAPSPVVRLNRAVARSMLEGPVPALAELEAPELAKALRAYPLFDAVRGELLRRAGFEPQARECFERARDAISSRAVRELLDRKLGGAGAS